MPHSRVEVPLRIVLGQTQYTRAQHRSESKADYPILLEDESLAIKGLGTPSTPPESRPVRPCWMIEASFLHGAQTAPKTRIVHISPLQAFVQLSRAFEGFDQTIVTNLALNLIKIAEDKDLLRGFSSVYVACACVLAAEMALGKRLLYQEGLASIGVETRAVLSAFRKLQAEMSKKRRLACAVAVAGAKGDSRRFPGKKRISSKDRMGRPEGSLLSMMRDAMIARGESGLSTVTNADELPEPTPKVGCPVPGVEEHCAADQEEHTMMFDIEDTGAEFAEFHRTFAYTHNWTVGADTGGSAKSQYRHRRKNAVVDLGMAVGDLAM